MLTIQKFLAPAIDRLLPRAKIVDAVNPRDLSRYPRAVRAYIEDPHTEKGKMVARTAIGIDKAFNLARVRRGEIACPILLLHGTDERVASASASLDFFRIIGSTRKRYLRLHGFFHELFEDPRTEEEVVKSIVVFASAGSGAFADIAREGEEAGGYYIIISRTTVCMC